jgi:hypothetical protein
MAACTAASAQSLDSLKSKAGGLLGSHSDSSSSSSSLIPSGSSLSLGSAQNAAGVLSYCQKQGYLPSAESTVKDKLLGSLGGSQKASEDEGYQDGAKGLLKGGNGQSFDLGNIKGKVAQKLCKGVADKAASRFLGG